MKKLLVASSALVAAAPAFANDVTLSGTFVGHAATTDLEQLSNAVITTLTYGIAYAGNNIGGNINFGQTDTVGVVLVASTGATSNTSLSNIVTQIDSANIYADSAFGKFNFGTSDGSKTDNDLGELAVLQDQSSDNVDFSYAEAALNAFTTAAVGTHLTYSNTFGPASVAVAWHDDGYTLSAGADLGDFAVTCLLYTSPSPRDA